MKRSSQIYYAKKSIFVMITSSMTSHSGLKVGPLYSFTNEITFFMLTKQRAKISSLNFLCICIMRLWLKLYKYIYDIIDDVTRSQNMSNFKLIDLRQYLSYSVNQMLKMSEMLMAIFLVYSPSGITSVKRVCRAQNGGHFENFEILNTASIWPQMWKDRPKLCQKSFYGDDVIDDVIGWPQNSYVYSLFIHV